MKNYMMFCDVLTSSFEMEVGGVSVVNVSRRFIIFSDPRCEMALILVIDMMTDTNMKEIQNCLLSLWMPFVIFR